MASAKAEATAYFNSLLPPTADPASVTAAYKNVDALAYALSQLPDGEARPVKIIIIGAGLSGLGFAKEVKIGNIRNATLTIYEKNSHIGGTWFENKYPGCACDVPIHNYQYTWAPNPHFSSYYAGQKEIQAYFESVADQEGFREYVKLSHKVTSAKWNEDKQKWQIEVRKTDGRDLAVSKRDFHDDEVGQSFTDEADIFINASGYVNEWKWPAIPEIEKFGGELLHSASWDPKVNLNGKTVALIGNGSSGVQILPAIIDEVEKVYVFMRSPTWITAPFAQKYAGPNGSNVIYTEEQKKFWDENPDEYLKFRKEVEVELQGRFRLYMKDSQEQAGAKKFCIAQMQEKLAARPDLAELLIPKDFAVGCRRPTPGNGYLEALCHEKCEVVWGDVEKFTSTGLKSKNGKQADVDSVICATGFNISFSPRFPVIGRNNVNLQEAWDKDPQGYMSVVAADMPNHFIFLGPGSPLGHGSISTSIEILSKYMVDMINKLQTQNYGSFCVKSHIPAAWQKHSLLWLEKSSWNTPCVSTFKNGTKDGRLISLHAGSRLQYFQMLLAKKYEDYDWTSLISDPDLTFAYCGNGQTKYEMEKSRDLTWFIPPCPREKNIKREIFEGYLKQMNMKLNGRL